MGWWKAIWGSKPSPSVTVAPTVTSTVSTMGTASGSYWITQPSTTAPMPTVTTYKWPPWPSPPRKARGASQLTARRLADCASQMEDYTLDQADIYQLYLSYINSLKNNLFWGSSSYKITWTKP